MAAPDSDSPDPNAPTSAVKRPRPVPQPKMPLLWPWLLAGLVVIGFILVVLWLIYAPSPEVRTDDARVRLHFSTVAPRIGGQVVSVQVNDNQPVRTGDLLARLDDRDLRTAVFTAEAALQRDEARVLDLEATIRRQPDLIRQAASAVPPAEARLGLSRANADRYGALAATGAGSQQDRQQADAQLRQAQGDVVGSEAQLAAQRHQLDILTADKLSAEAVVRSDEAQLAQARLNISYTRITAPTDGVVGRRTVEVGDYVVPGAALMTFMPLNRVYIEANYREVAVRHVRPGQHVRIHVDAYGIWLDGYVESLPPASGSVFSPVPPEDATGNFTKIVQRLPVKIGVSPGQPLARLLRDGLSVETTIDTHMADVVAAASDNRYDADVQPPVYPAGGEQRP